MKKSILSLAVIAMMAVTTSFAQSSLVATLVHDNSVTAYYGITAFQEAHEAAASGDVITLSSGVFNSVDITKAITLHGAGTDTDTTTSVTPTVLAGDFSIDIPDSDTDDALMMEGIYNDYKITYKNLKDAKFIKNRFNEFTWETDSSKLKDAVFVHCRIKGNIRLQKDCSATLMNCYVSGGECANGATSNFTFSNCVIRTDRYDLIHTSSIYNCVLANNFSHYYNDYSGYTRFNSSVTLLNSLSLSSNENRTGSDFSNIPNTTNTVITAGDRYVQVFKTYRGNYNDNMTFELTDSIKQIYLGTDGKEIGMFGGSLPYSSAPSYPQITKFEVAEKTSSDGKLHVNIEVKKAD